LARWLVQEEPFENNKQPGPVKYSAGAGRNAPIGLGWIWSKKTAPLRGAVFFVASVKFSQKTSNVDGDAIK
jgi:hypothetical protein